jgi:arginine/ornithine N-succinyltransferase beta subunit
MGFKSLPLAIPTITGLLHFDGRHKTEELLTQEGFRFCHYLCFDVFNAAPTSICFVGFAQFCFFDA